MLNLDKKIVHILSIDGGGIKGIIPLIILKYIADKTEKPIHKLFDVIGGTSTGGIIALGLNSKIAGTEEIYTPQEILKFYTEEEQVKKIFQKDTSYSWEGAKNWFRDNISAKTPWVKNWANVNGAGLHTSEYIDKGIKEFLQEKFGKELKMSQLTTGCDVTVYSYDIENCEPYWFNTKKAKDDPKDDYYVWQAARSTSAAPTFFPALESDPFLRFGIHEDAPTLAAHQNKVYMAWRGAGKGNENIFYASYDGSKWSGQQQADSFLIQGSPSLAVYQDKLYMAWRGSAKNPNNIFYASYDGSKWSELKQADGFLIQGSPSLAVYQDKLYMAWRGAGKGKENIFYASYDGSKWSELKQADGFLIQGSPSLAVYQDKLYMAWGRADQGADKIFYASFDGTNWSLQKRATHFKRTLVDGGIFINNPAMDLFIRAKKLYPHAEKYVLVSLGTGDFSEFFPEQLINAGLWGWGRPLISCTMKGASATVDDHLKQLLEESSDQMTNSLRNKSSYHRYNPEFYEDIQMDSIQASDIQKLKDLSNKFVDDHKKELDALIDDLNHSVRENQIV